ncbi:general odorant-binding protein 56h-like [Musca domestica]|uniref:General odorant-binding protein 56h-like n=1 Tax=Musca domestica TaxID=7370 RepID=A0A9J7DFS4_MUSDO|nr:general odorant-binding protein 56h-like [Musca domestica]
MKFLYSALVCLAFFADIIIADLETYAASVEACKKLFPVSEDEIKSFYENKTVQFSNDFKCHTKCILEKEHIFKNGKMDADSFLKHALQMPSLKNHQAEVLKTLAECKNIKGSNECDTAFKLGKCLFVDHTTFVH